jgi:nitrite reductase (NO-forming) / hydroxylamine reductase
MARFMQHEPPTPPEFGMKEIMETWKVRCRRQSGRRAR